MSGRSPPGPADADSRPGAGGVTGAGDEALVTLTVNPAIDAACVADEVVPMRKVRTRDERYDPGGGGINVARMIRELGGEAVAFYLAGGITGQALEGLIERSGIAAVRVPIAGSPGSATRSYETSTGHEFRFTPEGPEVTQAEWHNCLEVLSIVDCDYFVASGSLARGMPPDFYARVARLAKARGGRVVFDSSGTALHHALAEGVYLVKPSRRELEHLLGRKATTPADEEALAREVVDSGRAEVVALTLGGQGAVLATRDRRLRLPSPQVEAAAPSAPATRSSAPWSGPLLTAGRSRRRSPMALRPVPPRP